jgi:hypothetical protein
MNQKKILHGIIESIPLTLFVFYIHLIEINESREWLLPYLLSSVTSLGATAYLLHQRVVLDRLFIGINCYFLSGLLGLVLNWEWLNLWYGQVRALGMLYWIIACGVYTSFFSSYGFLGISHASKKVVAVGSLLLLLSSVVSTVIATLFADNLFWGEWFPFILLFSLKNLLTRISKNLFSFS